MIEIVLGFIGGYIIKGVLEKRLDREVLKMINLKESEYNNLRSAIKINEFNYEKISNCDRQMNSLKINIKKHFTLFSKNESVKEFYNSMCDNYINNLKILLDEEAD